MWPSPHRAYAIGSIVPAPAQNARTGHPHVGDVGAIKSRATRPVLSEISDLSSFTLAAQSERP
jgi:hypothetical protein